MAAPHDSSLQHRALALAQAKGFGALEALVAAARLNNAKVAILSGNRSDDWFQLGQLVCRLTEGLDELPTSVLAMLLKAGAPTEVRSASSRLLPLAAAARAGRVESLLLLLDAGAEVDASGVSVAGTNLRPTPTTALSWAAAGGHVRCLRTLVERGAVLDRTDADGHTAFFVAVYAGQVSAVRVLLELGADPSIRNRLTFRADTLVRRRTGSRSTGQQEVLDFLDETRISEHAQ
jgi:ankyrin repeat protein